MKRKYVPSILEAGFGSADLQCWKYITCTIYKRCTKGFFCQQIRIIAQDNIIRKLSSHGKATQSPNAIIGLEACEAVKESVERSSDADVMWSTFDNDGKKSFVGCALVYSDKPQNSLSS